MGDIKKSFELIAGSYLGNKPINFMGVNKILLKAVCINGSFVNGNREPILYRLALDQPCGHKVYKEPRVKLFRKINKSVLSHIMFYLENDDYKPVDFNG